MACGKPHKGNGNKKGASYAPKKTVKKGGKKGK
jgi:hypothetical protein